MLGAGFRALRHDVDTLYNRTVLGGLNRQDAALAALVLTSENVNGISLFDIYFAQWGFRCLLWWLDMD